MDQIIIEDKKRTRGEILTDFVPESFKYEYSKNDERSISFTAYRTNTNTEVFDMLTNEALVLYKGQYFVIKQTSIKSDSVDLVVDVTAKHIFMSFADHYILKDLENEELNNDEADDDNKPTYSLQEYLKFGFKDNVLGFTYKIVGDFKTRVMVDELGNKNGMEYLTEGAELYDYIYFADNKKIYIYKPDKFYQQSDEVIRYKHNTDEVTATITTTDLKTYIKGYGKKRTKTETKNYNPIKTPNMTLNGNWIKDGTYRTETVGASYEYEFNCKWGNETLVFSLKKGPKGGIVRVQFDEEIVGDYEVFSRTATTERIVIFKNIKKGRHTFKVTFRGPVPGYDYKANKPTGYLGTEKQVILNLTAVLKGEDLYHFKSEYKSPNYNIFGHAEAPTLFDDNALDKQDLLEKMKAELQDEPALELSTNYLGSMDDRRYISNGDITERSIIRFKHDILGYDTDLKVVKITESHPLVNQPVEVEFSNVASDIISIQRQVSKKIKQINQPSKAVSTSPSAGVGLSFDVVGSVSLDE